VPQTAPAPPAASAPAAPHAAAAATDHRRVEALITAHLGLVDRVVRQLTAGFPRHVDRDELHGAGAAGLVDAAHRYDPATGVPFDRYAAIRIRGAVLDATRERDWAPRRTRRDLRLIADTTSRLEEQLRRAPDEAEIAAAMGVDVQRIRDRRAAEVTSRLLALDRPAGEDGVVGTIADRIAEDDTAWLPAPALERNELVGTLRAAVDRLPEAPRRVLVEHHFGGRLLRDIADELGVTEARASQLRLEALHALQAYFATQYEGVAPVPPEAPGKRARASYVEQVTSDTTWATRLADA
jgi:RNA polymerase sigma factor FliA